jgi:asparagine synthase (glutamine-hydrolysing)
MSGLTISNIKHKTFANIIFSNKFVAISAEHNYSYPLVIKNINEFSVFIIEGKIYNKTLNEMENTIITHFENFDFLEKFFFNIDGEFNIYLIDFKKGKINIFGDHLNRLPLYYGYNENGWIVTRDLGAAVKMFESGFDKLALGEFFVFGYNLEDRTMFKNIYTLKLDRRLEVNLLAETVNAIEKIYKYSFYEKTPDDNLEKMYAEMKQIFIESCKNRMTAKSVLSLSGGMDSRTVAAGLKAVGSFDAISYLDSDRSASNDVQIASEIAAKINCSWEIIDLDKENMFKDMDELNRFKYGYQTPNLYFLNQYIKKVAEKFGHDITFFTGDGGDKVFPDLSGEIEYNDDEKLFRHIITNSYIFSLKNAAALSGNNENELKNYILDTIKSLPGNNSGEKLEFLIISGRARRWLFEGEDRNRQFFWETTPFYGKYFFSYMMKINNNIKRSNNFYSGFINTLNLEIAEIRNENVSSGKIVINKSFYNLMKKSVNMLLSRKNKEKIKSLIKGTKKPEERKQVFVDEIIKKLTYNEILNNEQIMKIIPNCSYQQISFILSILNAGTLLKKKSCEINRKQF